MRKSKIFSKITAAFAAVAIAATTITTSMPALKASAATNNVNIGYLWNSAYNPTFTSAKYANSNGISGQYITQGEQVTRFYATDDINRFLFCIDPATHMGGVAAGTSQIASGYTTYDLDKEETSNTYWRTNFAGTSTDKLNWQRYLGLVQYYGYGSHRGESEKNAYYVATQLLIWEMVLGYRGHAQDTFGTCTDVLWNDVTYPAGGITTQAATQAAYNDIVNSVKLHYQMPTGLYDRESKAKDNKAMLKFNQSTKRYEAKFTLPSSVTSASALRNWSNFRSALETAIKGKMNGTYGTDYGITTSTSGSNTIYTVWSNIYPFASSTVLSGSVNMISSPSVSSENTLFSKSGLQTCLFSPRVDPTSGYFALGAVNEPNITVEKTYTDAAGIKVSGNELSELLADTEFVVYTTSGSTKNYVIATSVGGGLNYTFREFTTDLSKATKMKIKSVNDAQDAGSMIVFDLPTDANSSKTYTVEEVTTPSERYEKLKKSATITVTGAGYRVPFTNEYISANAEYSTATLDKQIISSTIDSSTADGVDQLAEIYGNTKFVIGYWGSNSGTPVFRFFTNGYKSAAAAFSGDLVDIGGFTDKTYVNGDGSYYLPTRLSNNKLVFDWERTSEDISDAYIFDIGTNHNGTEKCDRFGEIYINLMPLWDGEAKEIFFIEVKSDSRYGYLKGSTEYTVEEVTNFTSEQKRSLSGVMQLPATTIGGITCPAGYYPIAGLNGTATAHNNSGDMANAELTYPVAFRKVNAKTGEYVTGATFGLYDADKQLIAQTDETNKNGYYGFTGLIPGVQYYIKEIESPAGFTLNEKYYSIKNEYTPVGGVIMAELDLINDLEIEEYPYNLTIEVNKYDQINGFAVNNITFDIFDKSSGDKVGTMVTDTKGYASFKDLPLGKVVNGKFEKEYRVVEQQDTDYIMVDADGNIISSFDVSVTTADITSKTNPEIKYTMDVPNTLQIVDLTVHKVDEENRPIESCVFELSPVENVVIHGKTVQKAGEVIGTLTTDKDGNAKSVIVKGDISLPMLIYVNHKYQLKEISCPDEYVLKTTPDEFTATSASMTVVSVPHEVKIPNEVKKGSVHVIKKTEGQKNIKGIRFTLTGTSAIGTTVNMEAVTDDNGIANFTKIPIGTYEITEDGETVPYAYLTAEKQSVTVDYAQTTDVEFFNKEKEGSVEVHKSTEGMINLGGIKFILSGISDSGRTIRKTATTNDNGIANFTKIPIGTYEITEDGETVPYAYLTAEKQSVTVDYAQTTDAEFYNEEKTGDMQIQKRVEGEDEDAIKGIKFILSGTSDSGREIYQEKFTDAEGKITFDSVPIGTYEITEEGDTVPTGYLVADQQEGKVLYASTTEMTFINHPTEVEVSKVSLVDGKEIEGASLQVIDKNGKVMDEWTSTTEPHYITAILEAGETYTLRETIAPDGYVISNDVEFTVNKDGSVTSVKMEDDVTKVTLSKKAITGDDELPGAKLKVVDENGEAVEEWTSTTEPHKINGKLTAGKKYKLVEEAAPDGYVISNEVEFTVNEDGSVTEVTMKDDTTKVKISKRDITTDEELPGAKLTIIDKDGKSVEEWTSTTEPHYVEGKLKAGETYTLREITAPKGYEVANEITFTVNKDGSVTEVVMKDTPTPDTPSKTSGGDVMSFSLILLAMASLLVLRKSRKAN